MPRVYLRQWAPEGQIGMCLVGDSAKRLVSVDDAGTRSRFYRRERPDGTEIDDVEWSLGRIEAKAGDLLPGLEDRWPLSLENKVALAEFFAVQAVRGPRAREWRQQIAREAIEEVRNDGGFAEVAAYEGVDEQEVIETNEKHLLGSTHENLSMLRLSRRATAAFGSMVWLLLRYRSPRLATADHPVVMRGLGVGAAAPAPSPIDGFVRTLEVIVPVSPTAAVLMAWLDEPPVREVPVEIGVHHARSLNSFAIANADRQWFFAPGTNAPTTTGALLPLSTELISGYSDTSAEGSKVRSETLRRLQEQAKRESRSQEARAEALRGGTVEVVTANYKDSLGS